MGKIKVHKIYEARNYLSSLVKDSANKPYLIGKRGKPEAVLINYKDAVKYLPKEYIENIPKDKLRDYALAKSGEYNGKPNSDLSARVDEILYGK